MIELGDEERDDDDSKKSSSENMEDVLSVFRAQWQKELKISSENTNTKSVQSTIDEITDNDVSIEEKAKYFFMKGVEHEENGKLYEAVRYYKKAIKLVPDIEFRLYEQLKVREKSNSNEPESTHFIKEDNNKNDISEKNDEEEDLLLKLSKIVNKNQAVCFPQYEQSMTHISALPLEIILCILRWVVSSDLDLRSLEMFSTVCRGFYMCGRDPEIWRLACIRIWGINCGDFRPRYQSWREMFLQRSSLRFNGCYISRTTYFRHGESAYQDAFYQPLFLVEYFRYLRFFPEGKVLMLTSTEEAKNCVNYMKYRNPLNPLVLIGHYRLHNDHVTLYLKKQETEVDNNDRRRKKKGEPIYDSGEQTFRIEFKIQNYKKKNNYKLEWMKYDISTKYRNGEESNTCFTLGMLYSPFIFSRVKSYTNESEAPLQ